MQQATLVTLVDFNYWANRKVLQVCERLTAQQWTQAATVSTRTLRGTLVHTLDTEWSWRLRLIDPAARGEEMREEDFPTVASLVAAWVRDEREMVAWVASLSDADLVRLVPVPWGPEYPRWQLIFHLLSHSTQQRPKASTLLTLAGHSPGDIEFLNYIGQA
ncbi:MAG: DinB family protein [Chloroflexi bacterium]|nr:DinB family protein [Chloroflexota bacterium]